MGKIEHPERLHLEAAWIVEDGVIVPADIKFGEGRGETQERREPRREERLLCLR